MRGLKALLATVIAMALLIAAGTAILVATVIKRLVHPAAPIASSASMPAITVPLDQPAGTRITGVVRQSDSSLALLLSGGGRPDRIVVWDEPAGRIVARADLER
ncbi:hypothetical protein [Lichenicoccus sp.]|uniref:hypothetical protein n=1 Tax=Lichenicoccus sp. TaxID=2781899 RepID=UPI003D0A05E4